MSWLDYVLIIIILVSTLISLSRGFVREALSLAVWIVAFWVGWTFFRDLAMHFQPWIESPTVRLGAAFGSLIVVTLIVGGLVNFLLVQLVEKTGMGGTDRLIGMIFGAARGVLLVSVLVILSGLTTLPQETWWKTSVLVPYFEELALLLKEWMPAEMSNYFRYGQSPY